MVMIEIGTDIQSEWTFNEQGDLNLIGEQDNLTQAISNRLQTNINSIDFYNEYGTMLYAFLGWKPTDNNLEFIRMEIGNRLMQDPRLREYGVNVDYIGDGKLRVDIKVILNEDTEFNESFVISRDGVEVSGD